MLKLNIYCQTHTIYNTYCLQTVACYLFQKTMRLPNHVLTWLLDLVLHLDIWFFKGDLYPKPPTCTTKVPWTRYVLTLLVQYVKQPVRGLTNRRSSGWVDPWRIILGSPPFIAAMIHGHLLKGSTHPIRKGDENYSNHSCEPLAEWDDPPTYGFQEAPRFFSENAWKSLATRWSQSLPPGDSQWDQHPNAVDHYTPEI